MAPQSSELRPEICIIGAGPGGLSVAAGAAAFNVKPVLVEKGRMGGRSLNHGSVPVQALIAAADHANAARGAVRFGINIGQLCVDFAAVNAHVHDVIGALAPNAARERLAGLGVQVIAGAARFVDPATVRVGDLTVRARRFVIATGSSPAPPDIPGLSDTPHLTEESIFDLDGIPRHLIIIGAGAAGLEFAQAFRRLGSEVTVLETATPLAGADAEAAAVVLDALAREGVKFRTGVKITNVGRAAGRARNVALTTDTVSIEGSHLLVTAGRRPNVEELGLDAAGIRRTAHGIALDKNLRTTNKRVYAIGDAARGPNFTHVAHYHAGLVIRHALFRAPVNVDDELIPSVTYTDPELAQVGLVEEQARARCGAIRVLRWPYRENDRAQADRRTHGHIKVITDRAGGILGATIVGPRAGESISTWTLAVSQKLNIRAFASLVVPYPTYAEVGKRAAITYFTPGLTKPRTRRIMAWLRRFR